MTDLHETFLAAKAIKESGADFPLPHAPDNSAGVEPEMVPPVILPDWMQKPNETFGNVRERFRRDLADILAGKKL